jgi:hypothetical protein
MKARAPLLLSPTSARWAQWAWGSEVAAGENIGSPSALLVSPPEALWTVPWLMPEGEGLLKRVGPASDIGLSLATAGQVCWTF